MYAYSTHTFRHTTTTKQKLTINIESKSKVLIQFITAHQLYANAIFTYSYGCAFPESRERLS
jgi:hypothetical protein